MKYKTTGISALLCAVPGGILAFFVQGHSYLGYALLFLAALLLLLPRLRRSMRRVLLLLLLLGSIFFAVCEAAVLRDAKTDADPEAPYLVVLGAGVNGRTPSLSMQNRLTAALAYLETYPGAVAIVSGGQGSGEEISEAEAMHTWLISRGVPEARILMEDQSADTQENLENSLALIRERGGDPAGGVAVVSSEYHLHRAKALARSLGAEPLGVAAETTLPTMRLNYFIREAFAEAYLRVFG